MDMNARPVPRIESNLFSMSKRMDSHTLRTLDLICRDCSRFTSIKKFNVKSSFARVGFAKP